MGRIWLIAAADSRVVEEVAGPLREHFGAACILPRDATGPWRPGDAVVAILEAPSRSGNDAPAPWMSAIDARVEAALAADAPLIPLLVDGVKMPPADELPSPLRPLAFKHALPLRSDERLPRDVGRLVEDLEAQLRLVVGEAFPYDLWLLPVGLALAAFGVCYSVVLVRDVSDWSFAYETADKLRRGMRTLAAAGPGMLGMGLLTAAIGLWWRAKRTWARQRAEFFRRGAGSLPGPINGTAWACFGAGCAALGWGLPAAAIASLAGAMWVLTKGPPRSGRRLVAIGVAAAVVGSAWTTWAWLRQSELRAVVSQYMTSRREVRDGDIEAAVEQLKQIAAAYPWYANAHYRLAEALADEGQEREAMLAVDAAIRRYPAGSQSVWGPNQDRARDALMLRANLHERGGRSDRAERDRQAASRVSGLINVLGGLMRFWETSPGEPAS